MADETGSQQGQGDAGTGDTSDDTTQGTSGAQGATGDQQDTTSNDADTVTRAEFDQLRTRMHAADRRAAAAEDKVREAERKDKSELENAQADLQTAQQRIAALEKTLNSTAVETAFVKYGKHEWVDVEAALRLLDTDGVEITDGKVTGLGPAIEKLAKAKPFLLKKNGDQNDSSGASGSASNGRRKGEEGVKPNLSSRFPALRAPAARK